MSLARRSLLALALFASPAAAEVLLNVNLMRCELQGGLQRNCAVPQGLELLAQQEVESDFYVYYTLSCDRNYSGPQPSRIQLGLDSGLPFTLNYKDSQNRAMVGTGFGPLVLSDSFPKELEYRSFKECQLSFSEVRAVPSARVRSVWQAELVGKLALLESKQDLAISLEKVALLMPAYRFFENLATSLDSDLKQNQEVLQLTRELSSCKMGEDCDLLYKLSSDMSINLTLEERLLVMQLRAVIAELPANEAPLTLDSRLSAASLGTLQKLAGDATFYEDAEAKIKQIQLEIEELRGKINILQTQIEGAKIP